MSQLELAELAAAEVTLEEKLEELGISEGRNLKTPEEVGTSVEVGAVQDQAVENNNSKDSPSENDIDQAVAVGPVVDTSIQVGAAEYQRVAVEFAPYDPKNETLEEYMRRLRELHRPPSPVSTESGVDKFVVSTIIAQANPVLAEKGSSNLPDGSLDLTIEESVVSENLLSSVDPSAREDELLATDEEDDNMEVDEITKENGTGAEEIGAVMSEKKTEKKTEEKKNEEKKTQEKREDDKMEEGEICDNTPVVNVVSVKSRVVVPVVEQSACSSSRRGGHYDRRRNSCRGNVRGNHRGGRHPFKRGGCNAASRGDHRGTNHSDHHVERRGGLRGRSFRSHPPEQSGSNNSKRGKGNCKQCKPCSHHGCQDANPVAKKKNKLKQCNMCKKAGVKGNIRHYPNECKTRMSYHTMDGRPICFKCRGPHYADDCTV